MEQLEEGRGVACVGGRAIGGDALAMQVHAGCKDTYRLESARHMHVANARVGDDCGRRGDAGGRSLRGRALVAVLLERARMAALGL